MINPSISITDLLTSGNNSRLTIQIYNQQTVPAPQSVTTTAATTTQQLTVQATVTSNENNVIGNSNQTLNKSYTGTAQQIHDELIADLALTNFVTV